MYHFIIGTLVHIGTLLVHLQTIAITILQALVPLVPLKNSKLYKKIKNRVYK